MKEVFAIKKDRDLALDFGKGLAIILMLYDHIVGKGLFITSFHMPLFFIISGYLLRDKTIKDTIISKVKSILLPYFEYSLVALLVGVLKQKLVHHDTNSMVFEYAKEKFINIFLARDIWLLWFLLALFEATIIYVIIKKLFKNIVLRYLIILLVLLVGYFMGIKYGQANYYYIDLGMFAAIFIAVGDEIKKIDFKKINKIYKLITLVGLIAIWTLGIKYGEFVMALRIYTNFPLCLLSAFAGTFVVIFAGKYLSKIPVLGWFIVWCGQCSLQIMCLGNIFRQFTDWKSLCNRFGIYNILVMFIIQLVMVVVAVIIWRLAKMEVRREN